MDDSEKTELTPANDNPWYWLATVYGEQSGESIDEDLAKKNRIAWNRWIAEAISGEVRTALIDDDFDQAELTPFSDIEKEEHRAAVLIRSGRESIALPEPSDPVDFSSNHFDDFCLFRGYVFPTTVSFRSVLFRVYVDFQKAAFHEYADFRSATFGGRASFKSTTFTIADFVSAKFSEKVYFTLGTLGEVFFESVTFSMGADFAATIFSGNADFKSAIFDWNADFESAKFGVDVDFVNTKFLSVTKFSKAVFRDAAPRFGTLPLKTLAHYTTDKTFAYSAEIFAIFQTIAGAVLLFLFFLALRNRFRLR